MSFRKQLTIALRLFILFAILTTRTPDVHAQVSFQVQISSAGTIYIRPDGSIDPPTAPISRNGNLYLLMKNIGDSIVIIRSNIIFDGDGYELQGSGWMTGAKNGFHLTLVTNVTLKNTRIKGFSKGIYLEKASNNTILNNTIVDNRYAIYLEYAQKNVLSNNNISGSKLELYGTHIVGTGIYLCSLYSRADQASINNIIDSNRIAYNEYGIELWHHSEGNMMRRNNITSNERGVLLWTSSDNVVSGNNITVNKEYGMQLIDGSNNNKILSNTIMSNWDGIQLFDSLNNTFHSNAVRNNFRGIVLSWSFNNRFYYNKFVDNTRHIWDNSWDQGSVKPSINTWDDGYPSGGNYWSDYTGADLFRGTNQNVTGSDGIGDTPHLIDANNKDRYPLILKIPTTIFCSVSPAKIVVDRPIKVSGAVTPAISGRVVTLAYKKPDSSAFAVNITTSSDGSYTDSYVPTEIGSWSVQASWRGDSMYEGAVSSVVSFTVTKVSTSILAAISKSKVTEGDSITVSGSISPVVSGAMVAIIFTKPDGSTLTRTVITGSDGTYTDTYKPDVIGSWTVKASWGGDSTYEGAFSSPSSFTVEKKSCIIATTTYGSELSPEVQFLREFRDNTVLNTFAGRNFMAAFNAWYYSFSPTFASSIAMNEFLRDLMKILLYPLIGVLHLSAITYSLLSFNPELAVVVSGVVASSLIGIMYITPIILVLCRFKRFRIPEKSIRDGSLIWLVSAGGIILAEIIQSSDMMRFSTAIFVLASMSIPSMMLTRLVSKIHRISDQS